jgi:hypothetical protein
MSDLGFEKVVGADAAGLIAEQVLFPRSSSEADVVLSGCCIPSGFTWVLTLGAMLPFGALPRLVVSVRILVEVVVDHSHFRAAISFIAKFLDLFA